MLFTAVLANRGGNTAGFSVPAEVVEALGGGRRPKVVVTLGEHMWRSSIAVYGGEYLLGVSMANQRAAQVSQGEAYDVEVTLDTDERTITPPADLVAALAQAGASKAWAARSYSHQCQQVTAIEDAKSPATRERRIAKTVADLLA